MKILHSLQIKEVDTYTIENEPILSIDLMERAAQKISNWIVGNFSKEIKVKIFVGPGNNGGDGLAVARQLQEYKYLVEVYILKLGNDLSNDSLINLDRLREVKNVLVKEIYNESEFPSILKNDLIIDALFGTGLTRKIEGLPKALIQYLNKSEANILAIDIPSGLFGEDNSQNDNEAIISAKYTLSFQMPKLAFLFPENERFVGDWQVVPIGLNQNFIDSLDSNYYILEEEFIKKNIVVREKFAHKGKFGHVLLIAGSYGKMGAAILAAKASLRTGCGLVTVHIPKIAYDIIQTALPEAMLSIDWSDLIITDVPDIGSYTSVGIGPGIGVKPNTKKALTNILELTNSPMVIDADALNIISEQKELIEKIPKNSILTPHLKEFERLVGKVSNHYERLKAQIEFSTKNQLIVVLKGAHTSITCPDGSCYFNSTGNAGMATAGSGDVLTGIILSLLGQGYESKYAAIIGVYLHGLSGDIAVEKAGQESVIASDIIENIGKAYLRIKEKEL